MVLHRSPAVAELYQEWHDTVQKNHMGLRDHDWIGNIWLVPIIANVVFEVGSIIVMLASLTELCRGSVGCVGGQTQQGSVPWMITQGNQG